MSLPAGAFKESAGGVLLSCRVQPGAKRSEIAGAYGEEAVRIALKSPPVDGKANGELLRMLAELCEVPRSGVTLKSGECSRSKVLFIAGVNKNQLINRLEEK